jgi:hypothetical protein
MERVQRVGRLRCHQGWYLAACATFEWVLVLDCETLNDCRLAFDRLVDSILTLVDRLLFLRIAEILVSKSFGLDALLLKP